MKINAKLLKTFVNKACFAGNNMSINLDFSNEGLKSSVRSLDGLSLTAVKMEKEAFTEYGEIGEIFIKDTDAFMKYLNAFEGDVSLELVDNLILKICDDLREAYVILGNEIVCENVYREALPTVPITSVSSIHKKELSRVITDIGVLKINQVKIHKEGKTVSFEVGIKGESDYFNTKVPIINGDENEGKVKVGNAFLHLYSAIDGEFNIHIGVDVPLIAEEKSNLITAKWLLAPIVTSD